jgi:hypothetical protein
MDSEKTSNLTLPPSDANQSASGVTTPDLLAQEKEQQQSYAVSIEGSKKDSSDGVPAAEYATGTRLIPVILALVCAVFLVALDMTIVGTAIPKITDEFHGLNMVSW